MEIGKEEKYQKLVQVLFFVFSFFVDYNGKLVERKSIFVRVQFDAVKKDGKGKNKKDSKVKKFKLKEKENVVIVLFNGILNIFVYISVGVKCIILQNSGFFVVYGIFFFILYVIVVVNVLGFYIIFVLIFI